MSINGPAKEWFEKGLPKGTKITTEQPIGKGTVRHFSKEGGPVLGHGFFLSASLFFVALLPCVQIPSDLYIEGLCQYEVEDKIDPVLTRTRYGFFISRYNEEASDRIDLGRVLGQVENTLQRSCPFGDDAIIAGSLITDDPHLWSVLPFARWDDSHALTIKEGRYQYFRFRLLASEKDNVSGQYSYRVGFPENKKQEKHNRADFITIRYMFRWDKQSYSIITPRGIYDVEQSGYGKQPYPQKAFDRLVAFLDNDDV